MGSEEYAVNPDPSVWRRCSACKKSLPYGARYYECSVSTCTGKRTGLVFCSVSCWDVHVPVARHREAWAIEKFAPSGPEADAPARAPSSAPSRPAASPAAPAERRVVRPEGTTNRTRPEAPEEILIIASRLKDYIRARSGYNTSDTVLQPLSDLVRRACDDAIDRAGREGRKTVLDRDIVE